MDVKTANNELNKLKEALDNDTQKVLFFIYCPCTGDDYDLVVYSAILNKNLSITGIEYEWRKSSNVLERRDISEKAKNLFYGARIMPQKRGLYTLKIKCFEEDENYDIFLHVKKSGNVLPKIVLDQKEYTLNGLAIEWKMLPPALTNFEIYTTHKDGDEKKSTTHSLDTSELTKGVDTYEMVRMFT